MVPVLGLWEGAGLYIKLQDSFSNSDSYPGITINNLLVGLIYLPKKTYRVTRIIDVPDSFFFWGGGD